MSRITQYTEIWNMQQVSSPASSFSWRSDPFLCEISFPPYFWFCKVFYWLRRNGAASAKENWKAGNWRLAPKAFKRTFRSAIWRAKMAFAHTINWMWRQVASCNLSQTAPAGTRTAPAFLNSSAPICAHPGRFHCSGHAWLTSVTVLPA